jgi:hypothetical protein
MVWVSHDYLCFRLVLSKFSEGPVQLQALPLHFRGQADPRGPAIGPKKSPRFSKKVVAYDDEPYTKKLWKISTSGSIRTTYLFLLNIFSEFDGHNR